VVAKGSQATVMGTALQSTGGFTQLYDPTQWDLTSEESNLAGNVTAIGISAGGISAVQLDQLKNRLTQTQTQLQAKDVTGLSGEQISGDLLSAVIWSWFAGSGSHNRLSQNQAGIVENPGLSYGLFHTSVSPIYSWGVARKVVFPGVNMDIWHVRNLTWAKDSVMGRHHCHMAHARQTNTRRCKTLRILPVTDLIVMPAIRVQVMTVHKLKAKFRLQKSVLMQE